MQVRTSLDNSTSPMRTRVSPAPVVRARPKNEAQGARFASFRRALGMGPPSRAYQYFLTPFAPRLLLLATLLVCMALGALGVQLAGVNGKEAAAPQQPGRVLTTQPRVLLEADAEEKAEEEAEEETSGGWKRPVKEEDKVKEEEEKEKEEDEEEPTPTPRPRPRARAPTAARVPMPITSTTTTASSASPTTTTRQHPTKANPTTSTTSSTTIASSASPTATKPQTTKANPTALSPSLSSSSSSSSSPSSSSTSLKYRY